MVERNSIESIEHNSIDKSNLNNKRFRLNKISEIEDYFIAEIKERELMSKKLSKYISFFDYLDKSLIVLSVTSGCVSYILCKSYWSTYRNNKYKSFASSFSLSTGLLKNY